MPFVEPQGGRASRLMAVPDPPTPVLLRERVFDSTRLVPGGRDRFHALIPLIIPTTWSGDFVLYYLNFSDGTWSAPVRLGTLPNLWFGGHEYDNYGAHQLVSDREGRALAIWRNEEKKFVARWIEWMQ